MYTTGFVKRAGGVYFLNWPIVCFNSKFILAFVPDEARHSPLVMAMMLMTVMAERSDTKFNFPQTVDLIF